MKKMLFIASLPYKGPAFNGETNKSRDVLNAIRKMGETKIDIINYTRNKYIQTIKLILKLFFKKYDCIFVSKCIIGGSFAIHIINIFKKHRGKTVYYLIGNGYDGFEEKKIYFKDITLCKNIIVESPIVLESMIKKGVDDKKMIVFPCLKPEYNLDVLIKEYPSKDPLRIIFFSRITKTKGLDLLMDAIIEINEASKKIKFILDISGGVSTEPEVIAFNEEVKRTCSQYEYINNLNLSLRIDGLESYKRLQQYDLHAFPSRFAQECAPGSILDMFIAGVPTLSSDFPSSVFIMNEEDSFFFKMNSKEDLISRLLFIYDNQPLLNEKRIKSHERAKLFSESAFIDALAPII